MGVPRVMGMTPRWETSGSRLVLVLVALAVLAQPLCASNSNRVQDAFRKLQSLEGDWQGTDQHGQRVNSYFSSIASNTAVMETLTQGGAEMVSLYSIEGSSITLVRYSPSNNQPHLRALPASEPVEELAFAFVGAANLSSAAVGHERKLVIDFEDKDHITEHWTWNCNGKDTETVFRLERVYLSRN